MCSTSALMSAPFGNLVAGTALGYLEHNTRFMAPVRPGDTLTIRWSVVDSIPKPRHGGGVVVAECKAHNQQGTVVADGKGHDARQQLRSSPGRHAVFAAASTAREDSSSRSTRR